MSTTSIDADAQDRADMERLAAGHDAALNDLMERHGVAVFRFLCRMLNNEEDAGDLAQETFVRVYRARERFQAGAKFSSWLFAIAANLARNHVRWRARHPSVALDPGTEGTPGPAETLASADAAPGENMLSMERLTAVRVAVNELPADLREAIVLCELEELRIADAAVIVAATPKSLESRLYRARKILREKLKTWL